MERKAASRLGWFRLRDGSLYFYNPQQAALQIAAFAFDVLGTAGDEVVEEPRILQKVRDAADRDAVIRELEGDGDPDKGVVHLPTLLNVPQTPEDGH